MSIIFTFSCTENQYFIVMVANHITITIHDKSEEHKYPPCTLLPSTFTFFAYVEHASWGAWEMQQDMTKPNTRSLLLILSPTLEIGLCNHLHVDAEEKSVRVWCLCWHQSHFYVCKLLSSCFYKRIHLPNTLIATLTHGMPCMLLAYVNCKHG